MIAGVPRGTLDAADTAAQCSDPHPTLEANIVASEFLLDARWQSQQALVAKLQTCKAELESELDQAIRHQKQIEGELVQMRAANKASGAAPAGRTRTRTRGRTPASTSTGTRPAGGTMRDYDE